MKNLKSRLAFQKVKLEEYGYNILYKPGRINHYNQTLRFAQKIFAHNKEEGDSDETQSADEEEIRIEGIDIGFKNFL